MRGVRVLPGPLSKSLSSKGKRRRWSDACQKAVAAAIAIALFSGGRHLAAEECGPPPPTRLSPTSATALAPEPRIGPPVALYTLGETMDAVSTLHFRSRGVREANPLLFGGRPAVLVPAKVAMIAALTYFDLRGQRSSSHTTRRRVLYMAGRVLLTGWNIHQAHRSTVGNTK